MAVTTDDYLWDRSGRDADVERLEHLLRPLALQADAPRRATVSFRRILIAGIAASLLVAVVSVAVRPGRAAVRPTETLDFGPIGTVRIEPGTRVRVLTRTEELIKLRLDRGTIHAKISVDARPRLFQVETPATTCIDLGCKYILSVDESGRSVVRVQTGRVAFTDDGHEMYIPAGASCRATRARGAGTPVYEAAAADLIDAVRAFDESSVAARVAAARGVAALARDRNLDWLPLWHLLQDADAAVAEVGADALITLVGLPDGVSREATLRRESSALEGWRAHLGMW
jgi:hypothetical protein